MAVETEHKYLVKDDTYLSMSRESYHILQGYLSRDPERTVRVRVRDREGFLTVKGISRGDSRLEFEYPIPYEDAIELLGLCLGNIIDKTRYIVDYRGHRWEIDKFESPRRLTVAEIELPTSDTPYELPPFVGENVTGNPDYYNSVLSGTGTSSASFLES